MLYPFLWNSLYENSHFLLRKFQENLSKISKSLKIQAVWWDIEFFFKTILNEQAITISLDLKHVVSSCTRLHTMRLKDRYVANWLACLKKPELHWVWFHLLMLINMLLLSWVYEWVPIWISCVLEQKHTTRLVVKDFWFIFSHILQFGNATYLFWWIMSFVNYDLFCLPLKLSWEGLFCTHQKWTLIHMHC